MSKMDRYLQIFYLNGCLLTKRLSSRLGPNPWRIVNQIRSKLRMPAAAVRVPINIEDDFKGVVDLVQWSIYNEGQKGSYCLFSCLRAQQLLEMRSLYPRKLSNPLWNSPRPSAMNLLRWTKRLGSSTTNCPVTSRLPLLFDAIQSPSSSLRSSSVLCLRTQPFSPCLTVCALTFPIPLNPRCSRTIRVYLRLIFS